MEYAKFLQETVQEMAREVQNSRSGEIKKTAEDLDEFLNRVSAKYQFVTKRSCLHNLSAPRFMLDTG